MPLLRALGALLLLIPIAACSNGPRRPPDIVLIVVDTLRADRVSAYGYRRATTPRIDALAARGIRFETAASTSSWTVPAHASLFTGQYPIRHGATQENSRLSPGPATLAELLASAGYETFGISANPLVGPRTGLARGFEHWVGSWRRGRGSHAFGHPNELAARRLLDARDPERPFFLFVNYIEPHAPYAAREPFRSRFLSAGSTGPVSLRPQPSVADYFTGPVDVSERDFAVLSDLYDGEVAYVDSLVGDLLDSLERGGALDRALVVLTADHGENLGDHGYYRHVFSLHNTLVRVPLIIVPPGSRTPGVVRPDPASLVDVFATLLAQAGVDAPPDQRVGRDLLGRGSGSSHPLFSEYYYPLQALSLFTPEQHERHAEALKHFRRRQRAVEHEGWRMIWGSDGTRELYEVHAGERRLDAADGASGERLAELEGLLEDFVRRHGPEPPLPAVARDAGVAERPFGDLSPEETRRLRALGYLR